MGTNRKLGGLGGVTLSTLQEVSLVKQSHFPISYSILRLAQGVTVQVCFTYRAPVEILVASKREY